MVTARRIVLQFLVVIAFKIDVNAVPSNRFSEDNAKNILSELRSKHSHAPLIIVVNKSSKSNAALRSISLTNQIDAGKGQIHLDDKKAKQYMIDILRSTGDENDPIVKQTNLKFENALRSQCTSYYQCEIKCEKIQRPKKNKCQKSCKDVYDYLMLCNPPGVKKKKKNPCECESDECGQKQTSCFGKTMPPSWRF